MNVKAVSKMALGSICIAAASFGIGKCSGNTETKNVDNILTEDVVEISQPAEEPALVSHEYNEKLDKRFADYFEGQKKIGNTTAHEDIYKDYGTYGASIYLQEANNPLMASTALIHYKNSKFGSDFVFRHTKLVEERARERHTNPEYKGAPELQEYEWLDNLTSEMQRAEVEVRNEILEEIKSKLFSNDVPTIIQCIMYLKSAFADEGLSDYEMEKLQADLNNFRKAQGKETTQTEAEYLAYMQFKRDSIISAHLLEEIGAWEEPKVRRFFKDRVANTAYRPKP